MTHNGQLPNIMQEDAGGLAENSQRHWEKMETMCQYWCDDINNYNSDLDVAFEHIDYCV